MSMDLPWTQGSTDHKVYHMLELRIPMLIQFLPLKYMFFHNKKHWRINKIRILFRRGKELCNSINLRVEDEVCVNKRGMKSASFIHRRVSVAFQPNVRGEALQTLLLQRHAHQTLIELYLSILNNFFLAETCNFTSPNI